MRKLMLTLLTVRGVAGLNCRPVGQYIDLKFETADLIVNNLGELGGFTLPPGITTGVETTDTGFSVSGTGNSMIQTYPDPPGNGDSLGLIVPGMVFFDMGNVSERPVFMYISNSSYYKPKSVKNNKLNGQFGQINLNLNETVDLTFEFYFQDTFVASGAQEPAVMPLFFFTFFDFDQEVCLL